MFKEICPTKQGWGWTVHRGHLMGGLSQSSESNALQKQGAYAPQVIEKYPASKHDLAGYELIGNLRLSESFLCTGCKTLQIESFCLECKKKGFSKR